MSEFNFISKNIKDRYEAIADSIAGVLMRLKVSPNALTLLGLVLSGVAGVFYSTGSFFWGGCLVLVSGICDALDGTLARKSGKASRLGAFIDSTFDRIGEIFIFLGFIWYFSGGHKIVSSTDTYYSEVQSPITVLFIILAVTGSLMVSYTRARAEGLGLECKVGLAQRPERMILLIIGSLLGGLPAVGLFLMQITLFAIAILANITAVQRILFIRKKLLEEDKSR
jgi:CDP-diacylglycerol--glycerol-3-phosphate 3-phosphatidyltransferase